MTTAAATIGSVGLWLASPPTSPSVVPATFTSSPRSHEALPSPNTTSSDTQEGQGQDVQRQDPAPTRPTARGDDPGRRDRTPPDRRALNRRLRPQQPPQVDGPPAHADRPVEPLSPQQIEQAIDILCQLDRERCEKLQDRRCEDPAEFDEQFARHGWRLLALSRLQQSNPELFNLKVRELRLDSQINTTAELYRQALASSGPEAAALEMQLKDLLRTQMELRLQVRGEQLLVLEQHVVAARDQLADDARAFAQSGDDMIARRLESLKQRPSGPDEPGSVEPAADATADSPEEQVSRPVFSSPPR